MIAPTGDDHTKLMKRRNIVVPDYRVNDAVGAIKGISEAGYTA